MYKISLLKSGDIIVQKKVFGRANVVKKSKNNTYVCTKEDPQKEISKYISLLREKRDAT